MSGSRSYSDLISQDHRTDAQKNQREIGFLAVWSVSSAKPGNGVEMLRDGRTDTFWQSDGTAPHIVNIQFPRKMKFKEISFYVDFHLDESYTPEKVSVRAGTGLHDLKEFKALDMEKPVGWISMPLLLDGDEFLKAFTLQLAILTNHQSGRDTHVRQVKVYGPAVGGDEVVGPGGAWGDMPVKPAPSGPLQQYAVLR